MFVHKRSNKNFNLVGFNGQYVILSDSDGKMKEIRVSTLMKDYTHVLDTPYPIYQYPYYFPYTYIDASSPYPYPSYTETTWGKLVGEEDG